MLRDRPTLEEWANHLDQLGIHHSGIKEENGGPLITLRDLDNIQVEVWAFDPQLVVLDSAEFGVNAGRLEPGTTTARHTGSI